MGFMKNDGKDRKRQIAAARRLYADAAARMAAAERAMASEAHKGEPNRAAIERAQGDLARAAHASMDAWNTLKSLGALNGERRPRMGGR